MTAPFWHQINKQLDDLRAAASADDAVRILNTLPGDAEDYWRDLVAEKVADAFFAGSGGDRTVAASLREAGWTNVWVETPYFWCKQAPDGSCVTYVEGDVYARDTRNGRTNTGRAALVGRALGLLSRPDAAEPAVTTRGVLAETLTETLTAATDTAERSRVIESFLTAYTEAAA